MPSTFYAPYGEQFNDYANAGNANLGKYELGSYLVLPDGRKYRFSLNDGTVEVAGNLYQSVVTVTGHLDDPCDVARAIGAVAISATLNTTAAAVDIYAEGIVHVDAAPGEGYAYRIRRANTVGAAHLAAISTGVLTANLDAGESVQVALTTSSDVTFHRNRFHQMLIHPAPPTGHLTGVSPGVAAADRFYWSQIAGEAAVLAQDILLSGLPVQASVDDPGAVESHKRRVRTGSTVAADVVIFVALEDSGGSEVALEVGTVAVDSTNDITGPVSVNAPLVGICLEPNANAEYGLIDLLYLGS